MNKDEFGQLFILRGRPQRISLASPALDKVSLGQQSAADALKGIKPQMEAAIAETLKTMGYSG